jgi:hypothetical protein
VQTSFSSSLRSVQFNPFALPEKRMIPQVR